MKRRCEFIRGNGLKCKNAAAPEHAFCRTHAANEPDNSDSSDDDMEPQPKKANTSSAPSAPSAPPVKETAAVKVTCGTSMDDILKTITDRLQNLEIRMRTTITRKVKLTKEKKAKLLYYHEHKKLESIVVPIRETFRKLGYPEDAPVPWQVVKRRCDELFDAMGESDKRKYYEETANA
jgi:hypothetical protein